MPSALAIENYDLYELFEVLDCQRGDRVTPRGIHTQTLVIRDVHWEDEYSLCKGIVRIVRYLRELHRPPAGSLAHNFSYELRTNELYESSMALRSLEMATVAAIRRLSMIALDTV